MDLKSLNSLLPDDFSTAAVADYYQSKANSVSQLISAMQSEIESWSDDPDAEIPISDDKVTEVINNAGFSNTDAVSLSGGFCLAKDFVRDYLQSAAAYVVGDAESIEETPINLEDGAGNAVQATIGEAVSSLKDSVISASCFASALLASAEDKVADKLTSFENRLAGYTDLTEFKDTVNYYKSMLINKFPAIEVLNKVMVDSGAQSLEQGEPTLLAGMDISKYTGANPLGVVGKDVKAVTGAIGKAVGAAAYGVYQLVSKGLKWIGRKVKTVTYDVFVNPYDVVDNKQSTEPACFNGFQYQLDHTMASSAQFAVASSVPDSIVQSTLQEGMVGKWYSTITLYGEIHSIVHSVNVTRVVDDGNIALYRGAIEFSSILKPYAVNETSFDVASDQVLGKSLNEHLMVLQSMSNDMYLYPSNATELELYKGIARGYVGLANTLFCYRTALLRASDQEPSWNPKINFGNVTSVTNRDWLKMACGYNDDTGTFDTFPLTASVGAASVSFTYLAQAQIEMILNSKLSANTGEVNVGFVPYRQQTTAVSNGRFTIKTDAENQNLTSALVTALLVIAVVVLVVVVGTAAIRAVTRRNWWKRKAFTSQMEAKLNRGEALTSHEKRKFVRYSRKLNGSTLLSSGISSAPISNDGQDIVTSIVSTLKSSDSSSSSSDVTLEAILHLISG